ncbi:MAG: DNA methyltransferase [Fimbriimonadales bacterium]|nr:DNA methyltransferase [Fimbriimonadales bacterium]
MSLRGLVEQAKQQGDRAFFERALSPEQSVKTLLQTLESLGRLPSDFDPKPLLQLAQHPHEEVRLASVRALARLENAQLLGFYCERLAQEQATLVRRELVSAIGRLRTPEAIPVLKESLLDADPKVATQAIRGLLVFRERPEVQEALRSLKAHPSELVRDAVQHALHPERRSLSKPFHLRSPHALKNLMVQGDALEVLRRLPEETVHLTFTSPPYYNARDYTLYPSYEAYLEFLTEVFREVHRVTKEGRFFVLNTSPVLVPRMSRQHASKRYAIPFDIHPRITALGFEFIDDIIWAKPAPSAKNRNGGFYQHRKPLGYKANSVVEYVMVYRKATNKLIDWNMRQYSEAIVEASRVLGKYEPTNLWQIAPSSDPVHPAVFPLELASQIIQLYSYKGDLILDPFGGSGTVGRAALLLERYFLLIEKDPRYFEYAKQIVGEGSLLEPQHAPRFLTFDEFTQLSLEDTE